MYLHSCMICRICIILCMYHTHVEATRRILFRCVSACQSLYAAVFVVRMRPSGPQGRSRNPKIRKLERQSPITARSLVLLLACTFQLQAVPSCLLRSMFELEAMYNWEISPKTAAVGSFLASFGIRLRRFAVVALGLQAVLWTTLVIQARSDRIGSDGFEFCVAVL